MHSSTAHLSQSQLTNPNIDSNHRSLTHKNCNSSHSLELNRSLINKNTITTHLNPYLIPDRNKPI
jgi:hypothetical protein